MNNLRLTLAGLLHDIGKFAQRADRSMNQSTILDEQSLNIAGLICRQHKSGYFTHQHVVWTNWFLEKYRRKFEEAGLIGEGSDNLINLAAFHHNPRTPLQSLVTLADHWSSGIDRNSDRTLEANPDHGRDTFRSLPMLSLFPQLQTESNPEGINGNYGFDLSGFAIGESIFPKPAETLDVKKAYPQLWKEFETAFAKLDTKVPERLIESIYYLLKRFTWYIPASTIDYPKTSLFEHQKITAAIAHCLGGYYREDQSSFLLDGGATPKVLPGHFPALMVCGDISGIQTFIYNVSNKRAMKSLKGRSFYVQMLSETIAHELSQACGGTVVNLVYAAGGKFYLLLPNTPQVLNSLESYESQIQEKLWQETNGGLNVYIGSIPFSMVPDKRSLKVVSPSFGAKMEDVGRLWREVTDATGRKKQKKFEKLFRRDFNGFFQPSGSGGSIEVCQITSEELPDGAKVKLESSVDGDEEGIYVSPSVKMQIDLGNALYNARSIARISEPESGSFGLGISTRYRFSSNDQTGNNMEHVSVILSNDSQLLNLGKGQNPDTGHGFRFYGGSSMASSNSRPFTLEELCRKSPDLIETSRLGVLRLDVDNLGALFMNGLPPNEASFSALTTLSALLDQFFSGHLNLIRNKEQYKDHINIVYAGGDDVFCVGRWDLIISFALEVQSDFKRFVCGRTDISLSGGLAIVDAKFPIAKAAEMAGEAEQRAKSHCYKTKEGGIWNKNALTIFGIPLNWEFEIPFVVECKNDLVEWISNGYLSKGFLMKLFEYHRQFQNRDPGWQWRSAYAIARIEKSTRSPELKQICKIIKTLLFTWCYKNRFHAVRFEALIAASRWAELELKLKQ